MFECYDKLVKKTTTRNQPTEFKLNELGLFLLNKPRSLFPGIIIIICNGRKL